MEQKRSEPLGKCMVDEVGRHQLGSPRCGLSSFFEGVGVFFFNTGGYIFWGVTKIYPVKTFLDIM